VLQLAQKKLWGGKMKFLIGLFLLAGPAMGVTATNNNFQLTLNQQISVFWAGENWVCDFDTSNTDAENTLHHQAVQQCLLQQNLPNAKELDFYCQDPANCNTDGSSTMPCSGVYSCSN
jgi:hypothetical protein